MTRRWLFLPFLTYLLLDLSNPFVAGAFNFNPDECVEALHRRASSFAERTDAFALPAQGPVVRLARPSPSLVRPLTGGRQAVVAWLVDSREERPAFGDPPPSTTEDH